MVGWFYPQTVEEVTSSINGKIRVSKFRGRYSVWVGGFEQSGPVYVEKVWQEGLGKIKFVPKKILILGLACGTLVKLLTAKWPKAAITGVELDPVMVRLGKKYFGLGKYKNLTIKVGDAKRQKTAGFDLVLVDAYLGGQNQLPKIKISGAAIFNLFNPKTLSSKLQVVLK